MNSARMDEPVRGAIDLETLRQFVGDEDDIVQHFLGRFFARLDTSMASMRRMILLQQWSEASRLAHDMRTSAIAIGASDLAMLCASMEKLAIVRDQQQTNALFDEMDCSFTEVQKAISERRFKPTL